MVSTICDSRSTRESFPHGPSLKLSFRTEVIKFPRHLLHPLLDSERALSYVPTPAAGRATPWRHSRRCVHTVYEARAETPEWQTKRVYRRCIVALGTGCRLALARARARARLCHCVPA